MDAAHSNAIFHHAKKLGSICVHMDSLNLHDEVLSRNTAVKENLVELCLQAAVGVHKSWQCCMEIAQGGAH